MFNVSELVFEVRVQTSTQADCELLQQDWQGKK